MRAARITLLGALLVAGCAAAPDDGGAADPERDAPPATREEIQAAALAEAPKFADDAAAFKRVYPFREDPHVALADLKERGRPGMFFYADPT